MPSRPNIGRYLLHSEESWRQATILSQYHLTPAEGAQHWPQKSGKMLARPASTGEQKVLQYRTPPQPASRSTPDQMDLLYSSHREPGGILDKDFQERQSCFDPCSGSQALQPTAGCCLLERGMSPVMPQLRRLPGLRSRTSPPRLSAIHPETPLDKLTGTGAEKLASLKVSQGG